MASNQGTFTGRVGRTGRSTGPHAHFQLYKDGALTPLSRARMDVGRYVQFQRPGESTWNYLYEPGTLGLHPEVRLTDPMGNRAVHPVTGEKNVLHRGEDYDFPEGTALRVLAPGTVTPMANVGAAGNISSFVFAGSPYKLETFHLSQLPKQSSSLNAPATGPAPAAPVLPGPERPARDALTDFMQDLISQSLFKKMSQQGISNFESSFDVPRLGDYTAL